MARRRQLFGGRPMQRRHTHDCTASGGASEVVDEPPTSSAAAPDPRCSPARSAAMRWLTREVAKGELPEWSEAYAETEDLAFGV